MISSGEPLVFSSSTVCDLSGEARSFAGVFFFAFDAWPEAGAGDALSSPISERRWLTPFVERTLRRGSEKSAPVSHVHVFNCVICVGEEIDRSDGKPESAGRGKLFDGGLPAMIDFLYLFIGGQY